METVNDHLSALTEHIHRLSVGEFQETVAGPQTDGPKRVLATFPPYLVDFQYKK